MGRTSRRWKIAVPLVSLALVGIFVHVSYNTNVLGDDELCGGLVSARAAEAAFSRTGRVSDDGDAAPRPGEAAFDCWLDNTSALPGSPDLEMHLYTTRDRGDEAFTGGGPEQAAVTYFSGPASGGVEKDRKAWVWLPPACLDGESVRVNVSLMSREGSADRVGLAALAVDAANRLMDHTKCDADRLKAPPGIGATPVERDADAGRLCGVPGFSLPAGSTGQARKVREIAPAARGPLWTCFVALEHGQDDDSGDRDRGSGFATYSVVQDPVVIGGIKQSKAYSEESPIDGWAVTGFDATHVVATCEGKETYFAMEIGTQQLRSWDEPAAPRDAQQFRSFVEKVRPSFGCSGVGEGR
ncbi:MULTISPECIES: hypothetical protein [Streptomyces]|uniref:DUF3558 domain-containing protein n=1 Tax=Streptomyces fradiae ATCC 10745 = DSM 40063 TaxID=1319510 RepID=A0A1Y2P1P4_STRFR|nr:MULTISPECIES: hypothetical protein [Streptomyces]OSY53361.1 hypothetical protein BG846_00983 [Streptomyces fradiae ATCC 10745 = DSM 40063]